jgi:hypothetical protein
MIHKAHLLRPTNSAGTQATSQVEGKVWGATRADTNVILSLTHRPIWSLVQVGGSVPTQVGSGPSQKDLKRVPAVPSHRTAHSLPKEVSVVASTPAA